MSPHGPERHKTTRKTGTAAPATRGGHGKPPATLMLVVVVLLAALVFALVPSEELWLSALQEGALACIALAGVLAARADALHWPAGGWFGGAQEALLLIGLTAGMIGAFTMLVPGIGATSDVLPNAGRVVLAALVCVFTGVFEECLFRGTLLDALRDTFRGGNPRRSLLAVCVVDALLFGAMHLAGSMGANVQWSPVVVAQALLKPLQAALFGFLMCAVTLRSRSLWPAITLHALFDMGLFLPTVVRGGVLPTSYVTGSIVDLAVLAATCVALAALIPGALRTLRK